MVRLASVEFTKLKNVRPGTRLVFPEAGAVLLGKNGTGKTTLLQYLVALCTADMSAFVSDEPFDVSATFRLESGATATLQLTGMPQPQSVPVPDGSPDVTRVLSAGESTRLEYLIRSPDESSQYRVSIIDGQAALYRDGQSLCDPFSSQSSRTELASCLFKFSELLSRNHEKYMSVSLAAIETLQLQEAFCRYDEGLDYFRMLTAESSSYLAMEVEFFNGKGSRRSMRGPLNRIPRDLFEALIHDRNPDTSPEYFAAPHSAAAFMREFVRLCRFSSATAIAPIEELRSMGRGAIFDWRRFRFTFELAGNRISHAKLSFGQKRLLSYLYYLACNTKIGIADELVNGMHHEWIDYCLGDACAGRQMFYTSQNPLLLDFLTFESEVEVSERLITCKWNEVDGFIWENLEPRVGEEFYRLYQAGIQHVSDILRTKGWW
jgi:energy-coupling factor transporter ATP-binding protein EcfA2